MAGKYYVVWAGRETGIFTTWAHTKKQVHKFSQAKHKSYATKEEAEAAFATGRSHSAKPAKKTRPKTTVSSGKEKKERKPAAARQPRLTADLSKRFDVKIYCDGACDPNPGEAGSGVAVYRNGELAELWYGVYNPQGTNNSAELNALYQALLIAQVELDKGKEVQILCDSKYSINCVTDWAFNWEKKGWRRKIDGDIKNLEIIQQSHRLYKTIRGDVVVSHVSAHVGIEGNELADRMSVFGMDQQETDFFRYTDPLEIPAILNFRIG